MKYQLSNTPIENCITDFLVIGIFSKTDLSIEAQIIDKKASGRLAKDIQSLSHLHETGGAALIPSPVDIKAQALLIINFGNKESLTLALFRKYLLTGLKQLSTGSCALALQSLSNTALSDKIILKHCVEQSHQAFYQFLEFKTKKTTQGISKVIIHCDKATKSSLTTSFKQACAIVNAMKLSKDLGHTPSNICTPTYLLQQSKKLATTFDKISVTSVNEAQMKKQGMGAILAVGKGSAEPSYLINIEYQGAKKSAQPIVLVGKGITFDTGGNNIKSPAGMITMKYDMGGGATVIALMQAIAEMNLPLNVVGIIAAVENMVDGASYKPSDIIKTLSGKTVEINNTDAEGRLVLCDALTYCKKYNPKTVIDFATLTGAAIVSLGYHATALFSNDQSLANELLSAGETSYDRAWQLPLWDDYKSAIDSPVADMVQTGGPTAGSIHAACFLSNFTEDYRWAHLDIAGSYNYPNKNNQDVTGRPIPMMVEYLLQQ